MRAPGSCLSAVSIPEAWASVSTCCHQRVWGHFLVGREVQGPGAVSRGMATRGRPRLADGWALLLIPGDAPGKGHAGPGGLGWAGLGAALGNVHFMSRHTPAGVWGNTGSVVLTLENVKGQEAVD